MKMYGFDKFIELQLALYEYASISLVVIEAYVVIIEGILLYDVDWQVTLAAYNQP